MLSQSLAERSDLPAELPDLVAGPVGATALDLLADLVGLGDLPFDDGVDGVDDGGVERVSGHVVELLPPIGAQHKGGQKLTPNRKAARARQAWPAHGLKAQPRQTHG
jgi:hypothetical protein